MSQYIVCRANVEVRVLEGRDTQWRITNADHNRDRKRLSMVVKLCERSTGLNFMPKLAKTVARQFLRRLMHSLLQERSGALAALRAGDPCYAVLADHQDCVVGVQVA